MIDAVALTKHFGTKVAVDHLTFTVPSGRVTGFLGPNGAGKSTTMRMILGLDAPTDGVARIDGLRYHEIRHPLRVVGALLDASWLHPNRSAHAHLEWLARSNKLPPARVDDVLEIVGLTAVASQRAGGFSLGMTQRLGIAAALLGDPRVLLFDEPVNGLDPEGILWIRTLMRRLADEGRTVFVSSHLLSEMALTADELVVIGRGKLITQCTTAEFVATTDVTTRVRSPHLDALTAGLRSLGGEVREDGDGAVLVSGLDGVDIGDFAAANGIALHELSEHRGSLEDAFLQRTGETTEYRTTQPGSDLVTTSR
ncbi:ATP-binding cassette domain-containing protein [Labedaea rhizosphaerae]|uniref:ABC-2 type transport system ATP-binding protein n=1 Tax=Labedaea rhizosphaerae TaxID=598644 RepID=A0A4V3CZQ7_LABRH|nr:ATP-binding cassette domain-containing protein [Labedaea rhizosphaerae]TDQ00671.1 ABC-2 type transport system ATP-binding protein [Labedaea rhizosphaerae]